MKSWHRWLISFTVALVVMLVVGLSMRSVGPQANVDLPWSYAFVLMLRDFELWLTRVEWITVFGAILIAGSAYVFWRLSKSEGTKFDFADAFAGENGKTSMSKVFAFLGGLTAIWMMVSMTITKDMTENYFLYFLAAVVAQKGITEITGVFRQAQIARTVEAAGGSPAPGAVPGTASAEAPELPDASARRPFGKRKE